MEAINSAYNALIWFSVIFLSLLIFGFLIRAIIGPRFTDRIIAINIISAKAIVMIVFFSHLLSDSGLIDIAMVYSMISFVAVVVLSKCFTIKLSADLPANEKEDSE